MKKTEFITFRTDQCTKNELKDIASKRKWSISFLIEEIVKEFIHSAQDDPQLESNVVNNDRYY